LQVADEGGEFLRMPIGHPALEVVSSNGQQLHTEVSELMPIRPAATVATGQGRRSAALVQQMSEVRKRTEQLIQRNQQLRHELSSVLAVSENVRVRALHLVAYARFAAPPAHDIGVDRGANKPARRSPRIWSSCPPSDSIFAMSQRRFWNFFAARPIDLPDSLRSPRLIDPAGSIR
jgi:hypothetical protein